MPPPADIVKVAIEWPGAYPKLMEIDQVGKAARTGSAHSSVCLCTEWLQTLDSLFSLLSGAIKSGQYLLQDSLYVYSGNG